ncbi:MAG: twin-arginine translocase subunit TatC [Rhodospirillum sp.]|nr:twin-arginine translocase subunit TatC [Rhodospirillum sp.]MCF8490308.1 twin-arginine translocase subunit TatC [Rhodospirillum sp.]MCF8500148.1 twin-arginine translocase subunit TatC [Rhodospirillum sp.]
MAPADRAPDDEDVDGKTMPLLEHLVELRNRLLWAVVFFLVAFFACFHFSEHIYNFLVQPLAVIMERVGGSQRMIYTALTEAFFTYVKVAAFGACVLSFPLFAAQLWMFIAPGLYRNEKRAFLPFLFISPVLFVMGAAMVYYLVMPMAWEFLLGFQTTKAETVLPIQLEAKVGEYLGLVMKLILAFGFSFQMPVVLTLMARSGLVRAKSLAGARKYAIVGVFVAAAVITPPDVISQVLLALPMLVLYEISIIAARMVEKSRGEEEDEDLDDDADEAGPGEGGTGDDSKPPSAEAIATSDSPVKEDGYEDDDGDGGVSETDWNQTK